VRDIQYEGEAKFTSLDKGDGIETINERAEESVSDYAPFPGSTTEQVAAAFWRKGDRDRARRGGWWRGSVHLCVMTPPERGVDRALSTLYLPDGGLS